MSALSARAAAFRLALFSALYFAVVGAMSTYWPAWLAGHGLDAVSLALLLTVSQWIKVPGTLLFGAAGRWLAPNRLILLGTLLAATIMALFGVASDFVALLLLMAFWGFLWPATLPLADALTLASAAHHGFDYGRVRLWGSVSYMAVAACIGWLVLWLGIDALQSVVLVLCAATLLAAFLLPAEPVVRRQAPRGTMLALLRRRPFLLLMLAAGAGQMSHAVYYGFSTIAWRGQGIGDGTIGLLWATGVTAEIALFLLAGRIVARIGAVGLLLLGGIGGVLRWSLMALGWDVPALAALQVLHALTFGATHLGAMHFMARAIAPEDLPAAQSLFYALPMGIGMGLATLAAGYLYGSLAGAAYWAMAGLSLIAMISSLILARRNGG